MNNALKDGLIRAMKDKMPGGNNLASALTEILCIGKEAVYRRLRGEVAFTFNEAAVISRELGISLDKIVGNSSPGSTVFDLNLPEMTDSLNNYYGILTRYLNFFRHIKTEPIFPAQFVSLGNGCPAKDHRHAYPAVQRDKASAEHGFHTRQYGILIVGKRNKIFLRTQSDIRQGYGQSKSGNTRNAERNGAYVD